MYGVVAVLLAAWLAGAAGELRAPRPAIRGPARSAESAALAALAADVQSQAERLRQRLAAAPAPQPVRNPFVFAQKAAQVAAVPPRRAALPVQEPAAPPEPNLTLLGIAEDKTPKGLSRTAILGTDGNDVLMVTEGQEFAGRYRVVAIGPDVIELKDILTGATRRLALR
jgi:hypothetical protein